METVVQSAGEWYSDYDALGEPVAASATLEVMAAPAATPDAAPLSV